MGKYSREMFVVGKINSYDTNNWDMVTASSIFKDEFKKNEADVEIILGYANALNCIAESLFKQNHPSNGIVTLRRDSLTIPFIFLARHTVELSLKYLCNILNLEYPPRHRLIKLWDKIIVRFNELDLSKVNALEDVKTFLSALEDLDCDGSHSRYSKNNEGELYNAEPKFINVIAINDFIQKLFVKYKMNYLRRYYMNESIYHLAPGIVAHAIYTEKFKTNLVASFIMVALI